MGEGEGTLGWTIFSTMCCTSHRHTDINPGGSHSSQKEVLCCTSHIHLSRTVSIKSNRGAAAPLTLTRSSMLGVIGWGSFPWSPLLEMPRGWELTLWLILANSVMNSCMWGPCPWVGPSPNSTLRPDYPLRKTNPPLCSHWGKLPVGCSVDSHYPTPVPVLLATAGVGQHTSRPH